MNMAFKRLSLGNLKITFQKQQSTPEQATTDTPAESSNGTSADTKSSNQPKISSVSENMKNFWNKVKNTGSNTQRESSGSDTEDSEDFHFVDDPTSLNARISQDSHTTAFHFRVKLIKEGHDNYPFVHKMLQGLEYTLSYEASITDLTVPASPNEFQESYIHCTKDNSHTQSNLLASVAQKFNQLNNNFKKMVHQEDSQAKRASQKQDSSPEPSNGSENLESSKLDTQEHLNNEPTQSSLNDNVTKPKISSEVFHTMHDMAPTIFARIRHHNNITDSDYKSSLFSTRNLYRLKSPGKSDSFFYITPDYKYFIKTLDMDSSEFLLSRLEDYYQYLEANPNTLLAKYFGLYAVQPSPTEPLTYFTIMENVFPHKYDIDRCYDLKGSSQGRHITSDEWLNGNFIMKDLDMAKHSVVLLKETYDQLLNQMQKDTTFLQTLNIMDYSLVIGVHKVNTNKNAYEDTQTLSIFQSKYGGIESANGQEIYYLKIVDILTPYTWKKILETKWKTIFSNQMKISSVNPSLYRERFLNFLFEQCFLPVEVDAI